MKKFIAVIFVIAVFACTSQKPIISYTPISQKQFLDTPFGFAENVKNFKENSNPKFKTVKLLRRNQHYPEKTDTIYQFVYKKSEIFFYKTYSGKEFLMTGKILNKQIELKNGIHVGISKDVFTSRFSDNLIFNSDSLQLKGEGTKYTFLFQEDKLYKIYIDNYYD